MFCSTMRVPSALFHVPFHYESSMCRFPCSVPQLEFHPPASLPACLPPPFSLHPSQTPFFNLLQTPAPLSPEPPKLFVLGPRLHLHITSRSPQTPPFSRLRASNTSPNTLSRLNALPALSSSSAPPRPATRRRPPPPPGLCASWPLRRLRQRGNGVGVRPPQRTAITDSADVRISRQRRERSYAAAAPAQAPPPASASPRPKPRPFPKPCQPHCLMLPRPRSWWFSHSKVVFQNCAV